MNLNCFVAKNTAHSVAIAMAARFIPNKAFTIPSMRNEKSVTILGIR